MTEILYSEDLSKMLGKTPEAIRTQIRNYPESLPPACKIGRRLAWTADDVNEWLEMRKAEFAAELAAAKAIRDARP